MLKEDIALWVLATTCGVLSVITARTYFQPESQDLFRYGKDLPEVLYLVEQAYVDDVDMASLVPGAIQGTLEAIDENASYIPRNASRKIDALWCYERTGLVLYKQNGYPYVMAVAEGSPAALVGLKPGMYLRRLGGASARHLTSVQAYEQLGKAKNLTVHALGIGDIDDQQFTFSSGPVPSSTMVLSTPEPGLSVLSMGPEPRRSAKDLDKLLQRVPAGTKLIIDLRGNALGREELLELLASRFLIQGVYANKVDAQKRATALVNPKAAPKYPFELFLLVDHTTSQMAEVFAGAAQTQKTARLVGEQTLGIPSWYEDLPLKTGGHIRLSTHHAVFTNDKVLTGSGLTPDMVVAVDESQPFIPTKMLKEALALVKAGVNTPRDPEPPPTRPDPDREPPSPEEP